MILSSREEIRKISYRVPKVPTTLNIVLNCHMVFNVIYQMPIIETNFGILCIHNMLVMKCVMNAMHGKALSK